MEIRWKLTDENDRTYNRTQWGLNVTHEAPGTGDLCTSGWIHVYTDPLLAVLLNSIHGNFQRPHLWKCYVQGLHIDDKGLKEGWSKVTTVEQVELPNITITQRVNFAILCALEVYKNKEFVIWAEKWFNNLDRSSAAAYAAAANAAIVTANVNANVTAAYAAAYAAYAAANTVANAAYAAANAVANAAANAAYAANLNLRILAKKALTLI